MKKEIKTELTRNKILSCALEEFGKNGYIGGSINNICARGIAKGLLYHNFASKDELYLACVSKCVDDFAQYIESVGAENDLDKYLDARLQFFDLYEDRCKILFEMIIKPQQNLIEEVNIAKHKFERINERILRKVLSTLKLREGVDEIKAAEYFRLMQGMMNVYFGSQIFSGISTKDIIARHETELSSLINYMIYGIVEHN